MIEMNRPLPSPIAACPASERINLSQLNAPQREAVTYGEGPLLILAGAGSGKTRVITYRIAHLLEGGVRPWNILAVTFTNKAAGAMRERIFQLTRGRGSQVWISTYHSFCAQFLRVEGSAFGLERNFAIYDEDDQKKVIKECLRELNLDEKKMKPGFLAAQISREKDQLMDAESFAIAAAAGGDPSRETLSSIYSLYQKKLEKSQALDFGDLIMKTVELLQHHPGLKEKYQERFHYVLVDEYQDTNRAQYVLTKTLAEKYKNICVVGDDDQAIYSWRGADIRNILDFEKDYPKVKVVKLEENYRSTQPILSASWKLVRNNELRKEKKLWTAQKSKTPVIFQQMNDELDEADWVIEQILTIQEQSRYVLSDFAVFYRTNAQSRVLEDALRRKQIPYLLVGNVRFYERAEVKDTLAYLKVIVNPQDDLSLKRIINCPPRGIGKAAMETIERFAAEKSLSLFQAIGEATLLELLPARARENLSQFRKMLSDWMTQREEITVSLLIKQVLNKTEMLEILEEESKSDLESAARLDNVQELMNATEEFEERSPDKTVQAYLEQVSLLSDIDAWDEGKNRVTLMTVHIAKGLEFPVVFLTGLEEGLFPLGEAQFSQEDLEEERRLAYVGMTRAKEHLFLTAAASRRVFGQTHWNLPSRFIQEAGLTDEENKSQPSPRGALSEGKLELRTQKEKWENAQLSMVNSQRSSSRFRVGERVQHSEFGNGRITEKSGAGDELKVVVQFDSGQWKKLLVKYAPLRRLHGDY